MYLCTLLCFPCTVMVDECTNVSNQEQVVIIFRWADYQLSPHEEFIGLCAVPSIGSSIIMSIAKETLVRINVSLTKLRDMVSAIYVKVSNMRG